MKKCVSLVLVFLASREFFLFFPNPTSFLFSHHDQCSGKKRKFHLFMRFIVGGPQPEHFATIGQKKFLFPSRRWAHLETTIFVDAVKSGMIRNTLVKMRDAA